MGHDYLVGCFLFLGHMYTRYLQRYTSSVSIDAVHVHFSPIPGHTAQVRLPKSHPSNCLIVNTLEYTTVVADEKRRAFATVPPTHVNDEVFFRKDAATLRPKDWS